LIISATPYRLSLLGGGTDYPNMVREYGGLVLGTTIQRYSYFSALPGNSFFKYKSKFMYSETEEVLCHSEIQHRVIKETLAHLDYHEPIQLTHISDCPSKTGLGSSSSFLVGMINTFYAMRHERISKKDLAKTAIYIEQKLLQECIGYQDSTWAAYGGFNYIEFKEDGDFSVHPFLVRSDFKRKLESHLMLWFTGCDRISHDVTSQYVPKLTEKVQAHKDMLGLVRGGIEAIYANDIRKLADLIEESWEIKKSTGNITNSRIDEICKISKGNGAWANKLIGGGGGGCILMVVPPESQDGIRAALSDLVEIPVVFDNDGSRIIIAR